MPRKLPGLLLALSAAAPALPAQQPQPLALTKELRIDGNTENWEAITTLAIASNGTIAVGQQKAGSFTWYDAKGVKQGSFGHYGEGPSEFHSLNLHGWFADTLWIADGLLRRISFISPQRTLVRSVPFLTEFRDTGGAPLAVSSLFAVAPHAIYPGGEQLLELRLSSTSARPAWYPKEEGAAPLVRIDAKGKVIRFIASLPSLTPTGCTVTYGGAGRSGSLAIPFCARQFIDYAEDGTRVALLRQPPLAASGVATSYHVIVLGVGGDTIVSRQITYTPVAVSSRAADSARAPYMEIKDLPPELRTLADRMTIPKSYPPVKGLMLGADNSIWISLRPTAPGTQWLVLDPKGMTVGTMLLPADTQLRVASLARIWVTETDDDGVASVVRYGLGARR